MYLPHCALEAFIIPMPTVLNFNIKQASKVVLAGIHTLINTTLHGEIILSACPQQRFHQGQRRYSQKQKIR